VAQGNKSSKSAVKRDAHGRIVEGTANPSGVSKERAACKRLFEESAEAYRKRLNEFVEQNDDKWLAFEAVKVGLAYAIGKPAMVISGEDGGPVKVHAVELLGALKALAR
jgi:hypothetical protein